MPIRVEVGMKEVNDNLVTVSTRSKIAKNRESMSLDGFINSIESLLTSIHDSLFAKALEFRRNNTKSISSLNAFEKHFKSSKKGGFVICYSNPDLESEKRHELMKTLKVSARCIPLGSENSDGVCIFTGTKTATKIIYAKSY